MPKKRINKSIQFVLLFAYKYTAENFDIALSTRL